MSTQLFNILIKNEWWWNVADDSWQIGYEKKANTFMITACLQLDDGPHTQRYELCLTKEQDLERNEVECSVACHQCDEEG